jgi:hypothetical protein
VERKTDKLRDVENNKTIGACVNVKLWNNVKIQAIREHRKTGEILDDAIRLYLKKNDSDEM